jgi:hypothetical protein
MAGSTSRAVTIAAKWLDGGLTKGADSGRKAVRGLADEVKHADGEARKAGSGWSFFQRRTDDAGRSAHKTGLHIGGLVKSMAGLAIGVGGGILALTTVKSSLDEVGTKAKEITQAQALGIGENSNQTLQLLSVYKQRGIGMQMLGMTMKQLAKSSYSAEQQDLKHNKSTAKAAESRQRQVEAYDRAVAKARANGTEMPTPLAKPSEAAEIGTKAKAYESLGIVVSQFRKLSATKQLEEIGDRLTKMPVGPERTRLATELLGKSAQKILPAFVKGEGSIKSMLGWAKEYLPTFSNGADGMEKFHIAEMRMGIATEGLKLRIGMALMPVVLTLIKTFTELYKEISHGEGIWKTVDKTVEWAVGVMKGFLHVVGESITWLGKHELALKGLIVVLGFLAAAWAVQKVYNFVQALKALWVITKLMSGFGLLRRAVATTAATMAIASGGSFTLAGAFGTLGGASLAVLPILGQVALAVGGIVAVAEGASRLLGKGSFIENVKEMLAGHDGAYWEKQKEAAEDKGVAMQTAADKKLTAARAKHPHWRWERSHHRKYPHLAQGTSFVRHGGWAVVGDQGPETVHLPQGASVDPRRGGLSGGKGGTFESPSGDLHVHVDIDRREVATAVLKDFRLRGARA